MTARTNNYTSYEQEIIISIISEHKGVFEDKSINKNKNK